MAQILLYKSGLTVKQRDRLADAGVIAIRTEHPEDFKFLDLTVPTISVNDMVWASLDACADVDAQYSNRVAMKLTKNLALIAKGRQSGEGKR